MSADAGTKKRIISTTIILAAITTLEFIIAFTVKADVPWILWTRNLTYGVLTLVKAYFIVSIFMHLGDEVRKFAMTILLPFIFIMWLVIGLVIEGGYWGHQDKKTLHSDANTSPIEVVTFA